MSIRPLILFFISVWLFIAFPILAQTDAPPAPPIAAQGRAFADSVLLRWAPTTAEAWETQLAYGYWVQRYTVEIDSDPVEVYSETPDFKDSVQPRPLAEWSPWLAESKYGAVAAQALYGERFTLSIAGESTEGVQFTQAVQERELRFSFHLLASDLEPRVAAYSGLQFTDYNVARGNRYLYRIISRVPDSLGGADTALVLLGPPDAYELPVPPTPRATDQGGMVTLRWEAGVLGSEYIGYRLERSADSLTWTYLSEDPLISFDNETTATGPYQAYSRVDSVGVEKGTLYYRLRGVNAFGELSAPSVPVRVYTGRRLRTRVAGLTGQSPDNQTADLRWQVSTPQPEAYLQVQRGGTNQGPFLPISDTLPAATTDWTDPQPGGVNYYRVAVANPYGEVWYSSVTMVQLIDSVPPAPPTGLAGEVSEEGVTTLQWQANPEPDVQGYRVYRRLYAREEFAQLTVSPVAETQFADSLPQGYVVDQAEYRVMAVDRRGNASDLSASLVLERPDVLPPKAPYLYRAQPTPEGIRLSWKPSASADVVRLEVHRIAQDERTWRPVLALDGTDTTALDAQVTAGWAYRYAIIAYDEAGNASPRERYLQARGRRTLERGKPKLLYEVDREGQRIRLGWESPEEGLAEVHLFRAVGEGPLTQLETLNGGLNLYSDTRLTINETYTYRILWVYPDGTRSAFSEPVKVTY